MIYIGTYDSPIGVIYITTTQKELTGVWFDKQRVIKELKEEPLEKSTEVMEETMKWLDLYFAGEEPDFMPKCKMDGTAFRKAVWEILKEIPYGETTTYGEIAKKVAKQFGKTTMSAQAVGGAVGHNPIGILVPCHRVVGTNGNLTGYAGGIDKKIALLQLEKHDMSKFNDKKRPKWDERE